jgi:hypothetical protein
MEQSHCTILLNPATKGDVLAACIQADAAVQAALIQAGAARFAAWMTIAAGAFAVLGGASAYWAATRQVRLAEKQYEAGALVYLRYLKCPTQNRIGSITHGPVA